MQRPSVCGQLLRSSTSSGFRTSTISSIFLSSRSLLHEQRGKCGIFASDASERHHVWRERRHYAAVRSRRDSSANPSIQNPTDGLAKLEKELDQKAVINPMFLGEVIDSFREKEIPIAQYSNRIVSLTRHIHGKNIHEYCVLLGALEDADLHVVAQSVHEKLRAHMLVDKSIQPSERYYELAPNLVKHQGKRKVLKLYEELRNNKVRDPVNGDYAPIPPTIYILNAFIWACGGQTEEDVKDAFKLFDDIKRDGLHPDAASFSALISVLGNVNLEKASQQREEQQQKQQQQGGEEGEGDEDYSARVDKAVELMGTMFKTHGVRPTSMVYNALFTCYENILVEELLIQARQRKGSARVPFLFVNDYLRDEREEVLDEMFDILEKIIRSTKPVLAQPKERAFQILLRCAVKLEHRDRGLYILDNMIKKGIDVQRNPTTVELRQRLDKLK